MTSATDDATSAADSIRQAAHVYRARGWRVIQLHSVGPDGLTCSCRQGRNCGSKGKHPIDERWQQTEPLSAADIEALWDKRPKANVGLATGEPSGFWVLDIDPDSGGFDTMRALVAEHGRLPETVVVSTGSGGLHYYFSLPGFDVRNSAGRVGKGVDVRGTGGQVVAPPSRSDRGDYVAFGNPDALNAAPDWLLELVRKPEATTPEVTAEDLPKPDDLSEDEWRRLSAYARKAIDSELDRLAMLKVKGWDEPWNHTTFQVACTLIEFANSPWCAYSLGQAEEDLMLHAPRDAEGFDDFVVRKTWNSARERIGDKARLVPESRPPAAEGFDLFDGVRHQGPPDPTGPAAGAPTEPRVADFFGGEKGTTPLYVNMAEGVLSLGELAWGRDEAFWSYAPKGVWVPDREVVTNRLVDLLGNSFRTAHVTNATPVVKRRVMRLTGDPVESYMNFANGMLDWRTGEIVGHEPGFCSTIQFPYDFDPAATCPHFEDFLADVMHEDYVELAWEMLGYLMMSGNPLQVAFLFTGTGGNGKGTLMRVIQDLLGGLDNLSTESLDDLNGNRFAAVNLFGKIANLAGDIDGSYQESTANFKKLTGEDPFPGERKYGDRFNFESWAVPVFSANKIPGSADVTEGYLRRWVILHFHKRITNVIPGLSDLLVAEVPGIAAKAIEALRALMYRKRFDPQGEALKGKEEFAEAIDQVRQWISSGDAIKDEKAVTPVTDLYATYKIWAERSGQGRLKQVEFSHRLEAIGYPSEHLAGSLFHRGLVAAPITQTTPAHAAAGFFDE